MAFAVLPNGTTLFAGQVIAPQSYWSGVNGKRFALDVVYQTGTTGTPNGGKTLCTGSKGAAVLSCSSATDLSPGQRIGIGTDSYRNIQYVNASNPEVVLVNLTDDSRLGATYSTPTSLSFSPPVLASEMQLPTKTSAPPHSSTWSQGDMEQNSGATANGVAAWINVAAGEPGAWAGVPLGDADGLISPSQLSGTTGSGNVVLAANPALSGHLNQTATGNLAGTCSMHEGSSCTFTLNASFASTPICIVTIQSTTAISGGCTVSERKVTITAAETNSATWGAVLIGNPN
jgi:hypothetical protein